MSDEDNNNNYINSGASVGTQRAGPSIDGHTSMANTQACASPRQTTNASTALDAFEQRLMDKALSKQRAVPFGDVVNDSNEVVDNNINPTTMSENKILYPWTRRLVVVM